MLPLMLISRRRGVVDCLGAPCSTLLLCGALVGCQGSGNSEKSQGDPSLAVNAAWGSGSGELGKSPEGEGALEGPKSFAISKTGTVWVLDQINGRLQGFAGGQPVKSVLLPERPFEDIALDGDGFVLVDLHATPAVIRLDSSGVTLSEVPLPGPDLPEPGLVTALEWRDDGAWLELDDEYSVHVTDPTGSAIERNVVPGTLGGADEVLRAPVSSDGASVFRQPIAAGPPTLLANVSLEQPIRERTLLATDGAGRVLLGLLGEAAQPDPETPPEEAHVLVVLDTDSQEAARRELPTSSAVADSFRRVRLGADGKVYALRASAEGVQIVKVTP